MSLSCMVEGRPDEGTVGGDDYRTLAAWINVLADRFEWGWEPFFVEALGKHSSVQAITKLQGAEDVEDFDRDLFQCVELARRLSLARPEWTWRVTDDLDIVSLTLRAGAVDEATRSDIATFVDLTRLDGAPPAPEPVIDAPSKPRGAKPRKPTKPIPTDLPGVLDSILTRVGDIESKTFLKHPAYSRGGVFLAVLSEEERIALKLTEAEDYNNALKTHGAQPWTTSRGKVIRHWVVLPLGAHANPRTLARLIERALPHRVDLEGPSYISKYRQEWLKPRFKRALAKLGLPPNLKELVEAVRTQSKVRADEWADPSIAEHLLAAVDTVDYYSDAKKVLDRVVELIAQEPFIRYGLERYARLGHNAREQVRNRFHRAERPATYEEQVAELLAGRNGRRDWREDLEELLKLARGKKRR